MSEHPQLRRQREKFWAAVDRTGGPDACWPWTKSVNAGGYGKMTYGGRIQYTHRLAYYFTHGPIPVNLLIDHLCRNRRCANPAHLRVTDQSANMLNRAGFGLDNKAGAPNVHWNGKKWRAQLRAKGRNYSGGCYDDLQEAAAAAVRLREQLTEAGVLDPV